MGYRVNLTEEELNEMSKIQSRGLSAEDRKKIRDDEYKTPKMLLLRAYVALNPKAFQRDGRYNMEQMRELIKDQAEYIKKLEAENEARG